MATIPIISFAQGGDGIPNEAEWNGGGYSLKKITSNTNIPSGVNFSYTILFTAPAGATSVSIVDNIPSDLVVVSLPTPALVNGVTPTLALSGTVGSQVVTYDLVGLPAGSASSGSFTIVVKFPEGTTCTGATARNNAGIFTDDWHYTPYVSTTASAVDPWKVVKSIVSGSGPVVNPNGGSCGYLMEPDGQVTYRISVLKNSPYYGNVVGQNNMASAVVTDVLPAGAVVVSSTCGIAPGSTGTITWQPNSGFLDAANPWAYYYCDITVSYPAASFPNGSFVNNQVDLDGIICNGQVNHVSNETCIEIGDIVANPGAYFQKNIYLTNRVPGCTGFYTVVLCNNGNVDLTAFNIDDVIPSGISVDEVKVFGGNATTTMALSANSGANVISSSITTNSFSSGILGYPVSDLQLQMTGTLPVTKCIYMYIYFTVEPNPTGTVVTNCADFDGLANSLTLPQACVSFTVDEGEPHPCLLKDICSLQASYEPGDIIRFRIRVQNIGSADVVGASFQDVLHSNFTYVGNESYYVANTYNPACSSGGGIPSGTTAWTGVSPSHSGNNLNWSLPDIPSDCQSFYVGYCGYYGTWGLPYYFIEFDVMVDSLAMPGVTPNNYGISGGNLTSTGTSNTVYALVVASFGQEVEKQVSTDGGSTFGSSGTVTPGGTARYRLNYKNTSNVGVTSINLVDLLPMDDGTNDWLILNRAASRGSQFSVTYNSNHSTSLLGGGTPLTSSISTSPGLNICLPAMGIVPGVCNPASWGGTTDQNIRMDYGSSFLNPGSTVREDFDVLIPANATVQETACNDFAAISTADFLLDGVAQSVALTPIAAPPVCITVDTSTSSTCCDSVRLEQVSDATGEDCCVRLVTDCEVKAINVHVSNGTISSASWNCGTSPSGYAGQNSFTFNANACVVDMINCFTPDQPGTIMVSYTIIFQNGEECEKRIELDCGQTNTPCCDKVKVDVFQDPDLDGECCARIVTDCEVDSIEVSISNGVFTSTTWNCGTVPAGYVGLSSYTFDANLCVVDMVNCVEASQTGVVVINYVVYFQNGETCEKSVELDCKAPEKSCCDSVKVDLFQDPDLDGECCARIVTDCEVDSIEVSISNGLFVSTTWNCGTVPAGYVGLSSYTFDANLCVVDMVNCVEASQTGVVVINYVVYFQNGETCEKSVELDCKAPDRNCCDSVTLMQVEPSDGKDGCCVELKTDCEVDSVNVTVSNGTISSANWNCGNIPVGYAGSNNFTFVSNSCVVELVNCFEASQNGLVSVVYTIYFTNGEQCEKTINLDCGLPPSDCCALVDFKLKHKWPHFNTQVGKFSITNLDPSSPICSITISAAPTGSFTPGVLIVDGVSSSQSWNSTSIPSSGNLSPSAINNMVFTMSAVNYHGDITICVVKCDGTECCFSFNWNKKTVIDIGIGIGQLPVPSKLVVVTVDPYVATDTDETIKYVSFGFSDEQQVENAESEFFAISAAKFEGDDYPDNLEAPVAAYMSKYNAFFELGQAKDAGESLGAYNLVFTNILPKLACTLYDEEGNILFSDAISINESDTIATANGEFGAATENMFEFLNVYPNPSNGEFNITYAVGVQRDVEIRVVSPTGQTTNVFYEYNSLPGIHTKTINSFALSSGLYKVVLISDDKSASKSVVIK